MPPHTGPISDEKVTGVVIPLLTEDGRFDGVIGLSIRLKALVRSWSEYPLQPPEQLIVVDGQGTVLFATGPFSVFVDRDVSSITGAEEIMTVNPSQITVNNIKYRPHITRMKIDSGGFLILGLCSRPHMWQTFFATHNDLILISGTMFALFFIMMCLILRERSVVRNLASSEEQKHLILNSAFEGIYGIDIDGNCTFCNAAALKILGYDEEKDLIGTRIHDLVHHTRRDGTHYPSEDCIILDALKKGEGINKQDDLLWRADGTSVDSETWAYPVEKGGKVVGAVVSFIDTTERKRTQDVLQRTARLTTIGQIASGVAHEINNPLATIQACAESLENKLSTIDPESMPDYNNFHDYLKMIRQEVNQCSQITSELLNLAREKPYTPKRTNLHRLIRNTLRLFEIQSRFELFSFQIDIKEDVPILMGDPDRLRQVLVILVENALEAMQEGGQIDISCWINETGDQVFIEVSDDGPGIPADIADHIFEPFYTTKVERGTGMGLAVAYKIIANHNGTITVDSKEVEGARFTITLPVNQETDEGES